MPTHDIIVIGASAGGVEALIELVGNLSGGLPASIFVTVHFPEYSTSVLPQILTRKGRMPARHPENGEEVAPGCIYVAPPNQHLIIQDGRIRLSHGPREHDSRPAIDLIFRSAAQAYGQRVVGVILTGTLGDGAAGLRAVKSGGGVAIVQDPQEAVFSAMPLNAIEKVPVDYILPLSGIAAKIEELAQTAVLKEGVSAMPDANTNENKFIRADIKSFEAGEDQSPRSTLTCPECGGLIWELHEGELVRYRCHVGHAYSPESLYLEHSAALGAALWTAVARWKSALR